MCPLPRKFLYFLYQNGEFLCIPCSSCFAFTNHPVQLTTCFANMFFSKRHPNKKGECPGTLDTPGSAAVYTIYSQHNRINLVISWAPWFTPYMWKTFFYVLFILSRLFYVFNVFFNFGSLFYFVFVVLSNRCRPARQSIVTVVCVSACDMQAQKLLMITVKFRWVLRVRVILNWGLGIRHRIERSWH